MPRRNFLLFQALGSNFEYRVRDGTLAAELAAHRPAAPAGPRQVDIAQTFGGVWMLVGESSNFGAVVITRCGGRGCSRAGGSGRRCDVAAVSISSSRPFIPFLNSDDALAEIPPHLRQLPARTAGRRSRGRMTISCGPSQPGEQRSHGMRSLSRGGSVVGSFWATDNGGWRANRNRLIGNTTARRGGLQGGIPQSIRVGRFRLHRPPARKECMGGEYRELQPTCTTFPQGRFRRNALKGPEQRHPAGIQPLGYEVV